MEPIAVVKNFDQIGLNPADSAAAGQIPRSIECCSINFIDKITLVAVLW